MTKEELAQEIAELGQRASTLAPVLLAVIHRLSDRDEIVVEEIISTLDLLDLLLPDQEGAGKELLQDLLQGLSDLGHDAPAQA